MLAKNLLAMADVIGVSHAEIGRQVGVNRRTVSYWALGEREVSEPYREELVQAIFQEAVTYVNALRRTAPSQKRREVLRQLYALSLLCCNENLIAGGLEPTATVEGVLEKLNKVQAQIDLEPSNLELKRQRYQLARDLAVVSSIDRVRAVVVVGFRSMEGNQDEGGSG